MIALGFDVESTGLKAEDGDKIIEIALIGYDMDTRREVDRFITRIDPERSIAAAAQEVHGISYDELVGKPKFRDVADEIERRFNSASLVVAHNLNFDAMFLLCEYQALGRRLPDVPSVDTMEQARWACPDGKLPRLGELAFALGVNYDTAKAHAADYDVLVMMDCFFKGLDRGFYTLPEQLRRAA